MAIAIELIDSEEPRRDHRDPRPILKGAKVLVCGIANEHSIAYGCAKAFRELGADLAITYLNEKSKGYVEPLARAAGGAALHAARRLAAGRARSGVRARSNRQWGRLDVLVHSIAWAPKDDLQGGC